MELASKQLDSAVKGEPRFTFLAVEPQNERPRLSTGVRKQMKSHLTLLQHKRGRQERAAKLAGWLTSSLGRQPAVDAEVDGGSCISTLRGEQAGSSSAMREDQEEHRSVGLALQRKSRVLISQLPSSVVEQSFSRGSMAFRTFALTDSENVIGASLSRLQLDVSSVLRFYHAIVDFQSRDFANHFKTEHAATFSSFMDIVLRDPIPLATAILITVRHLLLMRGTTPNSRDVYYEDIMRGYLVNRVNAALDDPARCISDPLIAAVALLAIYEVKYGHMREYHVHMAGLTQMVRLRGGVAEISRQNRIMGGFLIWQDKNSSAIADCQAYFEGSETGSCYKADSDMFTLTDIHSQDAGKRF